MGYGFVDGPHEAGVEISGGSAKCNQLMLCRTACANESNDVVVQWIGVSQQRAASTCFVTNQVCCKLRAGFLF